MDSLSNNGVLRITRSADGKKSKVDLSIVVFTIKKGDFWIAKSPFFKSIGYSRISEEAALNDHDRDVQVFFQAHTRQNTLPQALNKLGWSRIDAGEFNYTPNISHHIVDHAKPRHLEYAAC